VKRLLLICVLLVSIVFVSGQTSLDTTRKKMAVKQEVDTTLKQQKENIITASTIIKIENLGVKVNSEWAELRPTVSADGNLLFFIVENHPANTKYASVNNSQDIWFSEKDENGVWSEAVHLGYPLNTAHYNAVFWISPDNNRILLRNAFIDGAYHGKGISMSYLTDKGNWSEPNMLRIKNLEKYNQGTQYGATMAHDGKALLMYMSPVKGSYDNDLFVCFFNGDGTWTEPKSLGKTINLPETNEMTPYMAADGETMYFSSNRKGGFGDNDIWMTKRLDKTWTKWSEPVNLGQPINTDDWDAFFTLDAGGEYAYLTTNLDTHGESDIVRVRLLEKEKPNPVILVTGNVYNKKTKEPLSANLIYETLPDYVEAGQGISNPIDGAFKIVLPFDQNYTIRASADKFFAISENFMVDSLIKAGHKEIHKDLYLVPIEIGQVVRLNNVFFDFDKWDLRPESFVELDRVVKLLKENPAIEIEMSAHTDSYGTDEYNFKLSDNRARSCMEYIISKGIAASRITSQGYGESKPVVDNETDENRQLNRRVEFKITKN
jgi:OmpA-OmpF porin, OOP family